jgi:hypothetical protein
MAHPALPAILTQRDLSPNDLGSDPRAASVRLYAWMYLARTLDNRILELFRQGLIKGTVTGGQGHEALIVPLALLANKGNGRHFLYAPGPGGAFDLERTRGRPSESILRQRP